ncbi:MAG: argininosuccinate lyase [Eggerthellaceae bacterium]|nr:argininosuccinate lyase [Eggerthellaceae bacterium]
MALWSGRFSEEVSSITQEFGASLPVDKRLYSQDIAGSIAHAKMLAKQGIITEDNAAKICEGLSQIKAQIEVGEFKFNICDEDIHMAIESELSRQIGDAGARLHTGRSRNDQVATDMHLFAKEAAAKLIEQNKKLGKVLLKLAKENKGVILPGFTHLQHAQPVLLSQHILAYNFMFLRDRRRLQFALDSADINPLGCGAIAGTSYPIDREFTQAELGFSTLYENSMDAVSDRDYILDLLYACCVSSIHLSRLCEEIVLWSSSEFTYITLSDSFSTGSSIMPQKKNPDFAELTRGKTGRMVGNLVGLLTVLKSLPLCYNKDLQEDKEGLFDSVETLEKSYTCMCGMLGTIRVNAETMLAQCEEGFLAATDIADYLAKRGLPFRKAHEITGKIVALCEKRGCKLNDLELSEFRQFSELFEPEIFELLEIPSIVEARNSRGGTSAFSVEAQIKIIEREL